MAQGQAMIKTATVLRSEKRSAGAGPKSYQITNVTIANIITIGTKYEETKSAIL